MPCPEAHATIVCKDETQALTACAAAMDAFDFLAGWDLAGSTPVTIKVVERLAPVHGHPPFGVYDATSGTIEVLSFAAGREMVGATPVFGAVFDEELYRSFIAHEVTHAIADQLFAAGTPSITAHEYIAYVAQLATMLAILWERILAWTSVEGFTDEHEITEMYLALSPEHFAVKSYLHHIRPENGKAFIWRLLTGCFAPLSGWE
ncbi:MAG: DUF6639 family protein [Planctomycetota bacterium]